MCTMQLLPSSGWTTPVDDSPWVIKKTAGLLAFKPSSTCFKENGVPGGFIIFCTIAPFLKIAVKMFICKMWKYVTGWLSCLAFP